MRRMLVLFLLLLVASYLFAQPGSPSSAAHGTEKKATEVAHADESHGEHREAPRTYFGIPGWILKLLNMIAFFGVLGYFLRKPVAGALAARHEEIRRAAQEARARREKADQMASEIQARLAQIEQDVQAIRERAEADGQRQRQELIAAAEAEAQKILQSARNEVDNRLKTARHELMEFAGKLATDRAESILREKITESDQQKLFEESLEQVSEVKA